MHAFGCIEKNKHTIKTYHLNTFDANFQSRKLALASCHPSNGFSTSNTFNSSTSFFSKSSSCFLSCKGALLMAFQDQMVRAWKDYTFSWDKTLYHFIPCLAWSFLTWSATEKHIGKTEKPHAFYPFVWIAKEFTNLNLQNWWIYSPDSMLFNLFTKTIVNVHRKHSDEDLNGFNAESYVK